MVHEYDATDEISLKLFNETKHFLRKYANLTEFHPTTIILGTWYKGTPYPSSRYVGKNEVILPFLYYVKVFHLKHRFCRTFMALASTVA